MAHDLDPRIDGRFEISIDFDKKGRETGYRFKWIGGDYVAVTREFIELAQPVAKQEGDILAVGPYVLRLISWDELRNYGLYKRVTANGA